MNDCVFSLTAGWRVAQTAVEDEEDVEALYDREIYEADRVAARAERAERRAMKVRASCVYGQ